MKTCHKISDEEIVELYWQRNEEAIRVTGEKYGKFLYRIAYNILHDHRDSEECQNDTYHRVWRAIPPTKPRIFRAFLAGMMRNVAIDKYHENLSQKRIPSEFTVSLEECGEFLFQGETPDDELLAKELGKMISGFLRSLSEKDRYIFMSRFYLVEPIEVIAGELHLTESAVYKKLAKLKRDLKDYLTERGVL
ncbi:MAG: sigma-70 family RNA polymerase sigma factor [Clostridia bacterium]|nr:sigma-70 family RNA polymerase sigma factor [Clostridia bacterium]